MNQHVKDMLYDHQVAIDPEMLWSGIQQKQKQRAWTLWLGTLFGLLLLLGVGYYSASIFNVQNSIPILPENYGTAAFSDHKDEVYSKDQDDVNAEMKITPEEQIISIENKVFKTNESLKTADKPIKSKIKSHTSPLAEDLTALQSQKELPTLNTKSILNNTRAKTVENKFIDSPIGEESNKLSYTDKLSIDQLLIEEFLPIDGLDMAMLVYNRPYKKLKRNRSNRQNCYAFGKQRHPWSLYVYGGPSFLLKNLSTKVEQDKTYLSQREATENVLESWRAGAQFKYKWENGFYVKAGIEMNRLNEQLTFTNMRDSMYVLTDQVIRIIIDSAGDTTEVLGDVTVTETTTEDWVIYNKYQFVNIPLHVGYIKSKNRWSFAGEVGLHINVSFSFDGQLLTPTGQPIQDPSYFKTNAGSAISLTGGVGYQVLPRARLWLTPSYMKLLRPINIDAYPIDQEYSTMGLLAGIEFKF